MINSSISKVKLEKIINQRRTIKGLIMQASSAVIEIPNHGVLYKENVEWLKKFGITVSEEKDRDGRPIMFLDTREIELEIPQDHKTVLDREPLIDNTLRETRSSREER